MKDVAVLAACHGQTFKVHLGTAAQLLIGFIGYAQMQAANLRT